MSYRVADLFCGAGGLSCGTEGTPFHTVLSLDNWEAAIATKRANGDQNAQLLNLEDVDRVISMLEPEKIKLIMGGPPCQDFSAAGRGMEGSRAALTEVFARIITSVMPDLFLMENVPSARKSKAYARARELFVSAGYGLTEVVLNAAHYGVPQNRQRLFVIGSKMAENAFLEDHIRGYENVQPLTIRDYWPDVGFDHYYRHPRSYDRRAVFSVDEPSPTIRGVNRPRPKSYRPHPGDTTLEIVEALTAEDRAHLQTFPFEYEWVGTAGEIEQMIGNAVPPVMANKIFMAIWDYLTDVPPRQTFADWLSMTKGLGGAKGKKIVTLVRRAGRMTNSSAPQNNSIVNSARSVGENTAEIEHAVSLYIDFLDSVRI